MFMGNSFGYFSTDDADRLVLEEIQRVLKPGGKMILDLTDGGYMRANFAERSWEWVDDTCFVCRERQLSKDGKRLSSREVVTVTEKGVVRDQFYQERLYDRSELEDLIESVGMNVMVDLDRGGDSDGAMLMIAGEMSKRGEDLGMMECRMLVKAEKENWEVLSKGETTATSVATHPGRKKLFDRLLKDSAVSSRTTVAVSEKPPAPFPGFTVIMGDPAQSCFGKLNNTWNEEDIITRDKLKESIFEAGYRDKDVTFLANHKQLVITLLRNPPGFVFNLCDEGFDNDALKELHVPAILEMLHIPYSGAGPNCLAFCYDKGLVNRSADPLGIPCPRETFYLSDHAAEANSDLTTVHNKIESYVKYPAFIKPMKGDNSLGITARSIVRNETELDDYLKELGGLGIRDIIIQEYLEGTEYGVGMVGNTEAGFHFFPVMEVDFDSIVEKDLPPILGYESKWDPDSPYWTDIKYKRAYLSREVEDQLKRNCITLWERFGCRDYARFDFRCDKGRGDGSDDGLIKLLEVNPNPGWCHDGKMAVRIPKIQICVKRWLADRRFYFSIWPSLRANHTPTSLE